MLSENPRILDLKVNHLENLLSLFPPPSHQKNVLFLLYQNHKILKAILTSRGRIKIERKFNPNILRELKEEFKVDYAVALEKSALRRIAANFQSKVHFDENYIKQLFCLWRAISREIGISIFEYPSYLQKFKYLRYFWVEKIFKIATPKEGSIIFVIFSENNIFASFIFEIINGEIDLVTTWEFFDEEEIKIKRWQNDYRMLLKRAKDKIKKPFIGVFLEVEELKKIKDLKSLRCALSSRKIILDPLPTRFSLPMRIIFPPT